MTTSYTPAEIKQIAKISDEQHIALLTNCGVSRDHARQIIAMSDAVLRQGVAAGEARLKRTERQDAMIAAGKRELILRGEG